MDAWEKVELVVGDGGVEKVELECKGSENEVVFMQDSVSEVNGSKTTEYGKDGSGSRRGSAERNFQG